MLAVGSPAAFRRFLRIIRDRTTHMIEATTSAALATVTSVSPITPSTSRANAKSMYLPVIG